MRRAGGAGNTLWAPRGNGSGVGGKHFGSWPCAWSRLAVQGSKPVVHGLSRKFQLMPHEPTSAPFWQTIPSEYVASVARELAGGSISNHNRIDQFSSQEPRRRCQNGARKTILGCVQC